MLNSRTMLLLAQLILLFGGLSLVPASIRLFQRAIEAGMPSWHLWWIVPGAAVVGGIKARFVMRKRMRQNIRRLAASQDKLWPWQIYPAPLLIFIITMVISMNVLKRVFADNGMGLGILGGVDVGVAVALLVAVREYWRPENKVPELQET
jgi:hypothetical protein